MKIYKVRMRAIKSIEFACRVRKTGYKNSFPHTSDLLEISLLTEGEIHRRLTGGGEEILGEGCVSTITRDLACTTHAEGVQEHITVGLTADYDVEAAEVDVTSRDALAEEVRRGSLLLPYALVLPRGGEDVETAISEVIRHNSAVGATGRIRAISAWYTLAARLTDAVLFALSEGEGEGGAAEKYVRAAKEYIKKNYKEKIQVKDIAEELGISAGYLHGIFKAKTGMSIITYTNHFRVGLAVQYIKSRNFSLKEAAFEVGIDDPAYMSRLFKRVTGVSYRRFVEN